MARQFRLWENAQVVNLLPAAADAAGRTSAFWANIKFGHKAFLICEVNQGAANTVLFTPLQATSLAGANSKALSNPTPIAANLDTSQATGSDQFTFPTQATSYTTDAGVKNKMVIFEIDPAEVFDINNLVTTGWSYLGVSTGASAAGNITSARLIVFPLRDARQNPPTTYL
jgi:hypothetical protein